MSFLFICSIIFNLSFAQEPISDYIFSFALRGKALAGPTGPENMYGRMFTIGTEYRVMGKHSVGIDWINFRNSHEDETLNTAGYYENAGTFNYVHRKYFLIDYRMYLYESKKFEYNHAPYINLLLKTGKQFEWYYDGTGTKDNIPWNYYGLFNEVGLAVGMRLGGKYFGADLSLGFLRAYHTAKYGTPYNYPGTFKPHVRVNLFFEPIHIQRK